VNNQARDPIPAIQSFAIGEANDLEAGLIAILKRNDKSRNTIFGAVSNHGTVPITFKVQESSDNEYPAPGDAYAAINIRSRGATVASITVAPGGVGEFAIEGATEDYLAFMLNAPTDKGFGRVTVLNWFGELESLQRKGRP